MTYSRRNKVEEQQEAAQKARHIATICEQFHLTLDAIDWEKEGMYAPVKVRGVEISLLFDLAQREPEDLLRLLQIKLFERAALEATQAGKEMKALMWSPLTVAQPQAFLNLWIITLETDERVPIMENIGKDGQRVYELYPFDPTNHYQLAALFGSAYEGSYHMGDLITIKEHARLYTGEVIYSVPPDKDAPGRRPGSKGAYTTTAAYAANDGAAKYIVNCHDGFPHIVNQFQVVP
ncbi:MAG TPA: hypothetical protein VF458_02405 [Ktedonobacteraceae bacterium]